MLRKFRVHLHRHSDKKDSIMFWQAKIGAIAKKNKTLDHSLAIWRLVGKLVGVFKGYRFLLECNEFPSIFGCCCEPLFIFSISHRFYRGWFCFGFDLLALKSGNRENQPSNYNLWCPLRSSPFNTNIRWVHLKASKFRLWVIWRWNSEK